MFTLLALALSAGAVCPPGECTHWTLEVEVEFSADCVGTCSYTRPGVVVRPDSLVRRTCRLHLITVSWSCMPMEPLVVTLGM